MADMVSNEKSRALLLLLAEHWHRLALTIEPPN